MSTSAEVSVLCAGLLVVDLFVPPLDRMPEAGELVDQDRFLVDSGGRAANTATCLVRLGVRAGVAGAVGEDVFGDFLTTGPERQGCAHRHHCSL